MVSPNIIEKTPLSIMNVKDELTKIAQRDKELGYRTNKTQDYVDQFKTLTKKAYEGLVKDLSGLEVSRLKEIHILKIADILPVTVDELKTVLQGYTVSVNNDNLKKIVDTVKKHV